MKLLKVVANNFKMCDDNFTISYVPSGNKYDEDKEFELHEIDEDLYVLKTMAIVGKNASGKTTAVELLSVIYDIFSNYRINTSKRIFKFIDKEVNLDITFYHDGATYRYLASICKNEKLYKKNYKKSYVKEIFDYDKYEDITSEKKLPDDTSIIYSLLNKIKLRGIYCPSEDFLYSDYEKAFNVYKSLNNDLSMITSILKIFDEHLKNIEMISEKKYRLTFSNDSVKEVSDSELYEILSSGTTKGFGLFTFVIYSLKTGTDLIIDEVENHFHKTIVENLISLYKDKTVNKNNACLIFTTHYCELLDLFSRNDNIYISKFNKKIKLENMYEEYKFRPELSKSNKFYENAFNTNVNYESLMNFKRGIMDCKKNI